MDTHDIVALFTPMERRVAERILIGTHVEEIARELGLSDDAVKVHLRAILKKARCRTCTELAYRLHASPTFVARTKTTTEGVRTMMTKRKQLKRLHKFVEVMEQVRNERRPFDIAVFIAAVPHDEMVGTRIKTPLLSLPRNECGTASCMLGWAGRAEWFRERGLKTDSNYETVLYKGAEGFGAGADFFGLSYDEASDLFGTHNRNSVVDALSRLRKLITRVELGKNDLVWN